MTTAGLQTILAVAQLCLGPSDRFDAEVQKSGFHPFERSGGHWYKRADPELTIELAHLDVSPGGCAMRMDHLPGNFGEVRDALVGVKPPGKVTLRLLMESDGVTTDDQKTHQALIAGPDGPAGPTLILIHYLEAPGKPGVYDILVF